MTSGLTPRDRRWLSALLVLGTLAVALVLIGLVATSLAFFSDIILIFFLAWLLAFILAPVPDRAHRWAPRLPRVLVVAVTYLALLVGMLFITLLTAQILAGSITSFLDNLPTLVANLPELLAPWQGFLDQFGLRVDLQATAQAVLSAAGDLGSTLVQPLTDIAIASISVVGNLILILIFSLYLVVDSDRMLDFSHRLVPERYIDEYRLLRTSVSRSFGGFLRGQALLGVIYFFVALACQLFLGLEYTAASAALSGALMAIPFFGPFVAWMPPVIIAALTDSNQVVPAIIIMVVGMLLELNIVQPRIMSGTVGISPLVVLASVIIGAKIAGIAGAVFSVPIAAVLSSFFFFYLDRYRPKPAPEALQALDPDDGHTATGPPTRQVGAADPPSSGDAG